MERLTEGRSEGFGAAPVAAPVRSAEVEREAGRRALMLGAALPVERRRQVRGLLWVAAVVLVGSVLRAGVENVFPRGWWRLW